MTRLGPLERARARLALHRCASVGAGVEVRGRIWVRGGGRVRLGDRVRLDAAAAPIELHATAGAEIVIGDDVVVEGGTSIEARRLVTIEAGAHVGPSCKVLDNDFHGIAAREAEPVSLPVRVEAGARLGERCILLPGAHVRRGASLRAGTVVRGPPLAAAAGEKGLPPRARGALGRARDQVRIAAAAVRGAVALRRADRDGRVYAFGRVRLSGSGRIHLGDRAMFVEGMIPTRLVAHGGGGIEIGARSIVNYGAHLEARAAIRVGRRCMIASAVRLVDAVDGRIAPIAIGDDVWLAHGVTVLPGVTVGDGSVVSAGSVVTRDVPPRSMAAGNPARSMSLSLAGAGRARAAEPEPEKPGTPDARAGTRRPAE